MKKILLALADGSEEIEAVVVVDVLRRAGLSVTVAAVGASTVVKASRDVGLVADLLWADVDPDAFDALVLPGGGPGTKRLAADERVLRAVRAFDAAGKVVAAICAAPAVLSAAGVLRGRRATCYPGCEHLLAGAAYTPQGPVVTDGNIITSQGPGTSFDFALALAERLAGAAQAAKVRRELLC